MAKEFGDYSLEAVRSSLDLAFDVVLTAIRHPKAKAPKMETWAEQMAHVPTVVEGWRTRG